jgi:hypothetical protein
MVGNIETNPGPEIPRSSSSQNDIIDKTTTLFNLNIRSLRNKIDFRNDFAEDFDILLLTGTHIDDRIDECDILLESFSNIIQRQDTTNADGGLLINAKDTIRMVRKQELENSIDETHWVKINAKGQSFLLCNTYRAQWTDLDYYSILVYAIELAIELNEHIVLVGDLNSNLLCVNDNNLVDIMNTFVFKNVIDKQTRVTENYKTLLD